MPNNEECPKCRLGSGNARGHRGRHLGQKVGPYNKVKSTLGRSPSPAAPASAISEPGQGINALEEQLAPQAASGPPPQTLASLAASVWFYGRPDGAPTGCSSPATLAAWAWFFATVRSQPTAGESSAPLCWWLLLTMISIFNVTLLTDAIANGNLSAVVPKSAQALGDQLRWRDYSTQRNTALDEARQLAAADSRYAQQMRACATVFTAACFLRSVWPRVDVERICFWDESLLSTTLAGRSAAFCAEMSLAWQFSSVLGKINDDVQRAVTPTFAAHPGFSAVRLISNVIFPSLCVAQYCCWNGVLSTNQVWHIYEESLW